MVWLDGSNESRDTGELKLKIIIENTNLKSVEYCCNEMADCVTKRVMVLDVGKESLYLNNYAVKWCPFCEEKVKYKEV